MAQLTRSPIIDPMPIIGWDGGSRYLIVRPNQEEGPDAVAVIVDVRTGQASPELKVGSIVAHDPDWETDVHGPDEDRALSLA